MIKVLEAIILVIDPLRGNAHRYYVDHTAVLPVFEGNAPDWNPYNYIVPRPRHLSTDPDPNPPVS